MGCRHSGVRCDSSHDSIGLLRQADVAAYDGDIRSHGGTDGRRRGRRMDSLSDKGMVVIPALVPAGAGPFNMLVPLSPAVIMAQDAAARQRGYARGQHRGRRQHHAHVARQRLPVHLFGAHGVYDRFAHADHDAIPAQPTKA